MSIKPELHYKAFVATSIDGYIAGINNELDWLQVENPDNDDCGYNEFIQNIDVILMGRNTYEIVSKFPT